MNSIQRKTKIDRGVYFNDGNWLLNVYLIQSDESENISPKESYKIIENMLKDIEGNCMSKEFVYFRTGFVFLHYGNRGVDLSIWHIGRWGDTFEIFNRSWYCYNRDILQMEALDDAEPVLSQYETLYLNLELKNISNIISTISVTDSFRKKYLEVFLEEE